MNGSIICGTMFGFLLSYNVVFFFLFPRVGSGTDMGSIFWRRRITRWLKYDPNKKILEAKRPNPQFIYI